MTIINQLPSGWLVDPNGDRMVLFIKDPMSQKQSPKFYIDKWSSTNGNRSEFQKRKIVLQEDAVKIWNKLIDDGWNKSEPLKVKAA